MNPYKDPDEFIKNLGPDEYRKRIDEAKNALLFEIEKIREKYSADDPDENTLYANEVSVLLSDIKDEISRTNYIKACAKEMGITVDALTARVSKAATTNRFHENATLKSGIHNKKEDPVLKTQQLMLTYLSEYPAVYPQIKHIVNADDFTDEIYHRVAERFFEDLNNSNVSVSRMVNMFEDAEDQNKVSDLFTCYLKGVEDTEEKAAALVDIIYRLKNNSLEVKKASEQGLSPSEFMKCKKELMEIRNLKIKLV